MLNFQNFLKDRRGNISVLFGVALVPMVVAGGVGVEYSRLSGHRTQLQAAMDAAVLAGVLETGGNREATAKMVLRSNLPSGAVLASEDYADSPSGVLTGNAKLRIGMQVASLFGKSEYDVSVKSSAKMGPPTTTTTTTVVVTPPEPTVGGCVLVLDPIGTQALLVNSGAQVVAPDCEVHVKSKASPAAIFNAGTSLQAKRFCIEGLNVIENSTKTDNLELGCKTVNDNFAGKLPTPNTDCTVTSTNYSGTVTLNPGVYCGWFNFNGVTNVTFNPGVYVVKAGGWNVNGGSFKGTDVSFYFADTSKIQFNSGMDTDLLPPTSGPLKSVLFFEAAGLPVSDFIFNNSVRNKMDGLIYLPSRNVTFNADSKLGNDKTTIIVNRLIWNQVKLNLVSNPDVPLFNGATPGTAGGGSTTKTTTVTVPGKPQLVN